MLIDEEDYKGYLEHYGTPRRSGRYPWGSGQTPDAGSFLGRVEELRKSGMKQTEIAKAVGLETTTQLRAHIAIAGNEKKAADIAMAQRLKEKNMSNTAIAERMFGSKSKESVVRSLLAPGAKDKADLLSATSEMLRKRVEKDQFIDIGKGVANQLGIAPTKLGVAVAMLEAQGYAIHKVPIPQLGTPHDTNTKVLCPPGTEWKDVMQNREKIAPAKVFTQDGGRTWDEIQFPLGIDSKRIQVIHKEDGGDKQDGVIYVRPGPKDLDMGGTHYAQTRILVDGTHYLKGMAVRKDNLPPGVDLQFHTNKSKTDPKVLANGKYGVMKEVQRDKDGNVDPDNPFGSAIGRQIFEGDGPNRKVKSVINIVNEEENWDDWSKNLASQMLSKQKPTLVKSQLEVTYQQKKDQLDEIMRLTNPAVKARLLKAYADDMDSSAVHLKAAHMPRQKTHVILPLNTLKENEVYAPNFKPGETVALIRYPHGGKFEIPELVVNNRNAQGRKLLGNATAAIGINHKVANRLSGADFDGDTVVVIPNNQKRISTEPPLPGLQGFDPQRAYPEYPGMKRMSNTQTEMGLISNLITDMTIKGANHQELAQAVRHSMVVIDAEKHGLNYKQSAIDNGITALRKKYQTGPQGGASTLISRTTGKHEVPDFKPRPMSEGGPIDLKTGKLVFVPTGKTRPSRNVDPNTGEVTWTKVPRTKEVRRGFLNKDLSVVEDAFDLVEGDGTPVERLYADYSNKVRDLANKARLETTRTKATPYSESARQVYSKEVDSLNAKLDAALKHAPLERQAQVIAGGEVKLKKASNPNLYDDRDLLKKVESQALRRARQRTGAADKARVDITEQEWKAIQAGAIRPSRLEEMLSKADIEQVKQLATPRSATAMTSTKTSRARALANAGYTQAEIAEELGVSLSTLRRSITG